MIAPPPTDARNSRAASISRAAIAAGFFLTGAVLVAPVLVGLPARMLPAGGVVVLAACGVLAITVCIERWLTCRYQITRTGRRRFWLARRWYAPYSTATTADGTPVLILDWTNDERSTHTWVFAYIGDDHDARWLPLPDLVPASEGETR